MKALAFDISTNNTGWSYIDLSKTNDGYRIDSFEYGNIQPSMTMDACQKIYFFGNRMKELIEKFNPDEIAFEEAILIMGHGFTTARALSRYNGVGVYFAYQLTGKEIFLYEPSHWKKQLGLDGFCQKAEVQLEVSKRLKLITPEQHTKFLQMFQEEFAKISVSDEIKQVEAEMKQKEIIFKESLVGIDKGEAKLKLAEHRVESKKELVAFKNDMKKVKKKRAAEYAKALNKIGTTLYTITGMNPDVADSFGVNFCMLQEFGFK